MDGSVLCVGQLVADIVLRPVDRLPYPGRTEPVEDLDLLSGGCAANTAAVLAKLGAETKLVALIGKDSLGAAALADQRKAGVDVSTVTQDPGLPTSVAVVLVDGAGQRSFYYRAGGCEQLANCHVPSHALKGARFVHVGGAMKLLALDIGDLMAQARAFGCTTSLDTDWDIYGNWMRKLESALPKIDYLITNEEEAAMLGGKQDPREAAAVLLGHGPQAVLVKRGERGAALATPGRWAEFPAYAVDVRDTTCAGDAFAAGFIRGLGLGRTLEDSVRLGNAAGALCTTRISHRGITTLEAALRLVAEPRP
jgi:sugar/nucleoside kinase (ribokinase family)